MCLYTSNLYSPFTLAKIKVESELRQTGIKVRYYYIN